MHNQNVRRQQDFSWLLCVIAEKEVLWNRPFMRRSIYFCVNLAQEVQVAKHYLGLYQFANDKQEAFCRS
jgi:hypothetical protein